MFVELHILQNFAPSNLNRDDTGAPKDCEFGGTRRARVSSQCFKRAIRERFKGDRLVDESNLSVRTKRVFEAISKKLAALDPDRTNEDIERAISKAINGLGLQFNDRNSDQHMTQYLLFLGENEIARLAEVIGENWEALVGKPVEAEAVAASDSGKGKRTASQKKQEDKSAVPASVQNALKAVLNGGKAVDLALFGRMIADLPEKNIDAACQVAHAISTNRVSMEFDFYTAVDDLNPEDTAGAGMLGTIEYNSSCFYRYANINADLLLKNLGNDEELARASVRAFIQAAIDAVPSGKANSHAQQNPPSFVMAVVRDAKLWSLANAFLNPVRPDPSGDLVDKSVVALDGYWGNLTKMYGKSTIKATPWCALGAESLPALGGAVEGGVDGVIEKTLSALSFNGKAGRGGEGR